MKKNFLIYIFFLGCVFSVLSVFFRSSLQEGKEELNFSLMSSMIKQNINKNEKGVLFLDISSPIFYGSGDGLLGAEEGVETWIQQVEDARENKNIKGLLMRIDSPGGGVVASEEFYNALVRFRESGKKIVVSVKSLCASGSYYISVPAHKIIVNEGSIIGSIGVIISSLELEGLYEKIGVKNNVIKSGKYKDILSPSRKMTKEERKNIQSLIDDSYQQFLSVIYTWRAGKSNKKKAIIKKSANGMIYSAEESIKRYLVDEIGDFEKAKEEVAKLCNLNPETLNLIYPTKQIRFGNTIIEVLLNSLQIPFFKKTKKLNQPLLQYMYLSSF